MDLKVSKSRVFQVLAGLRLHQNHPGIQAFGLGALGNLATAEDNCVVILKAGAIDMAPRPALGLEVDSKPSDFYICSVSNKS